ncbi:hypothetical protein BDV23DRAFT_151337 [Aspergillus alliaceus]|uniref:Uncharacterized protein n=1 Tax=Petromyces alliaceus TaxID=209559 RepID=A0A5N7CDK8_PETAA|nr:hypothetical protein BDV23DRAFT_151337 [Aspergillus alliaceus]
MYVVIHLIRTSSLCVILATILMPGTDSLIIFISTPMHWGSLVPTIPFTAAVAEVRRFAVTRLPTYLFPK